MLAVVISVAALFLSLALLVSGSAVLGTLISLRLDIEGFSDASIGLIMAFYSLGFVLGAIWGSSVIRQVGHIRAYATFAAVACAVTLAHPLLISAEAWSVMRLLMGFCLAGLMTVTESWINDRATNQSRGKLLGIYTINFYLASSAGQLLIGFVNPEGFAAFSLVAMLVVLSLVPLSMTRSLVPAQPSHADHLGLRNLATHAPAGITGALVAGVALGAFLMMGPLYAIRNGLDLTELSRYMSFTVFCAVLLQWPAGWLSDYIGRLPVLTGLAFVGAMAAAAASVLGGLSLIGMFLFSGIFFAVATSMYPVSVAITSDQFSSEKLVAACAGMLRVYGIGTIVGPLLAAALMGLLGPSALFMFISVSMLLAGMAIHYLFRAADEVPLEEQGDYAPVVPVSSPVITEIDPRNEEFEAHHEGEPAEWDIADRLEMLVVDPDQLAGSVEQVQADEASFYEDQGGDDPAEQKQSGRAVDPAASATDEDQRK